MITITRANLAKSISQRTGYPSTRVTTVIKTLIDEVLLHFRAGDRIELRKLGTFYPSLQRGRAVQLPHVGRMVQTQDTLVLKFKPSKFMRRRG
jgi:nucleoid DNA-binding protein